MNISSLMETQYAVLKIDKCQVCTKSINEILFDIIIGMTYKELLEAAVRVREKYNQLNARDHGGAWDGNKLMAGFVGDVGDLSKIVMAKNGFRAMDDVDNKLQHELSDCLWSILALANYYDIDLETQFVKSMNELEKRVDTKLAE